MYIKAIQRKRLQINVAIHWNQTTKPCTFNKYDYSRDHEPWFGAFEIYIYKLRVTINIWRQAK